LVANDALLIWNTTVLLVMCHFPDTSLVVMAWYTLATILLKVLQDAQTALIARLLAFFNVYSAAISLALAIMSVETLTVCNAKLNMIVVSVRLASF
jgi:hypothetical protein